METRRCINCTVVKDITEFTARAIMHGRCGDCRREYSRAYYREYVRPAALERYRLRVVESLPDEEWREVYPSYFASSHGRIKSTHHGDKILAPSYCGGYAYVNVPPARRLIQVHSLVARAFHGERPQGRECDHIDRNRANNRADNLRWVTHAENMANTTRARKNRRAD